MNIARCIANLILRPYRKTQGAKQVSGETFGTRLVTPLITFLWGCLYGLCVYLFLELVLFP
jgi:hypothetical protein